MDDFNKSSKFFFIHPGAHWDINLCDSFFNLHYSHSFLHIHLIRHPGEITPFPTVFKRLVLQADKKYGLVQNRNKLLPSLLFVFPLILNNLCNFEVKISSVLTEILQNIKVLSCDQRSDNTCCFLFSLSTFHMRSRACIHHS